MQTVFVTMLPCCHAASPCASNRIKQPPTHHNVMGRLRLHTWALTALTCTAHSDPALVMGDFQRSLTVGRCLR